MRDESVAQLDGTHTAEPGSYGAQVLVGSTPLHEVSFEVVPSGFGAAG